MREDKFFNNKEANEGRRQIASLVEQEGKKFIEKTRWPAKKMIMATLMAATLAPSFTRGQNNEKDFSEKNPMSVDMGADTRSQEDEKKIKNEQKEEDKKILDEYAKKFEENKHEYVRSGEDAEAVIRASLSALKGKFETVKDLRNSILGVYGYNLEGKDMFDLYSFIENGCSTDINKENDVKRLQEILNKIAGSAQVSDPNSELTEVLESNSSKPKGVDNMLGIATQEAMSKLAIDLSGKQDKIDSKGTPNLEIGKDTTSVARDFTPVTREFPPEERGKVQVGLEVETPDKKSINTVVTSLRFNPGDIQETIKSLETTKPSQFDTIKINGVDRPWGDLNDLSPGEYVVESSEGKKFGWKTTFEFKRINGAQMISNFNTKNLEYHQSFSCDLAVKKVDKETGESFYAAQGIKYNFGKNGSEMGVGVVSSFENKNEIGGRMNGFYLNTGGWNFTADSLSVDYQKENGEYDFQKFVDDVLDGEGKAKIAELVDRTSFGGKFDLRNEAGTVHIWCDGESVFYNNGEFFRARDGNFGIRYASGNGAVLLAKEASFWGSINGSDKMTIGELTAKLENEGPEIMLGAQETAVGFSLLDGVINAEIDVISNVTDTTFANSKEQIEKFTEESKEEIKTLNELFKTGNMTDAINGFYDFRAGILSRAENLFKDIIAQNGIEVENWQVSIDFKKLSENFKLIGEQGKRNEMYSMDVFFKALGNDLGTITLNKQKFEEYNNSENKNDYVIKQLGLGNTLDEAKMTFINNAINQLGPDIMKIPARQIFSAIDAINNGSTAGITLNGSGQLLAFYSLKQRIEKLNSTKGVNLLINVSADITGSGGENGFVPATDKEGKEHLGIGYAGLQNKANISLILVKNIISNEKTSLKAFGGISAGKVGLNNINISYSDGKGNVYNITSIKHAVEILETGRGRETYGLGDVLQTAQTGVPYLGGTFGVKVLQEIRDYQLGAGASASYIPVQLVMKGAKPEFIVKAEASVEKDVTPKSGPFSKITFGNKVNFDKQKGQGFINQFSWQFTVKGQLKSTKVTKMENYQKDNQGNPITKARR